MPDNHENNSEKKEDLKNPSSQQEETSTQISDTQPETQPEYKDLYMRALADLQNMRRRADRDKADLVFTAQTSVLLSIIPVIEDIDRALSAYASAQTPEQASIIDGLLLIKKNLNKKLSELNVEEITTTGSFNPEVHEALAHVESPDHTAGSIVQTFSKGYTFMGKVIKPARVSVAK